MFIWPTRLYNRRTYHWTTKCDKNAENKQKRVEGNMKQKEKPNQEKTAYKTRSYSSIINVVNIIPIYHLVCFQLYFSSFSCVSISFDDKIKAQAPHLAHNHSLFFRRSSQDSWHSHCLISQCTDIPSSDYDYLSFVSLLLWFNFWINVYRNKCCGRFWLQYKVLEPQWLRQDRELNKRGIPRVNALPFSMLDRSKEKVHTFR